MKNCKLQKEDRKIISKKYHDNPLFIFIFNYCKSYRSRLDDLSFSIEDFFLCVIFVLDEIKENIDDESYVIGISTDSWNSLKCEIREDADCKSTDDLELCSTLIITLAMLLINMMPYNRYKRIRKEMIVTLTNCDKYNFTKVMNDLLPHLQAEYEVMKEWIGSYMTSEEYITDDADDALRGKTMLIAIEQNQNISARLDQQIKQAIDTMLQEKQIKNKYDFAWIKLVLENNQDKNFASAKSFVTFLEGLAINEMLPSESIITKYVNSAHCKGEEWTFTDNLDSSEAKRRNMLIKRFIHLYKIEYK